MCDSLTRNPFLWGPPEPHQVRCITCEQRMKWRRGHTHWEGDYEYNDYHYECPNACQTSATVSYRTFIPIDVARMRNPE